MKTPLWHSSEKNPCVMHSRLIKVQAFARLQAGYELRNVRSFDAALLLSELVENLQPLAIDRGLFLRGYRIIDRETPV